ncbi:MAG: hypothetical protein HF967_03630 [Methanosarcinales archaeon]|nr:hypothetical protein [Methanosarcinales archaeon]
MTRNYETTKLLATTLTESRDIVSIPTRNIIKNILLTFDITYNTGSNATVDQLTYEDLSQAIPEIRLVSDGNVVHYSLQLSDLILMNYIDTAGRSVDLDAVGIPADTGINTDFTVSYTLNLRGGDILAFKKQLIELSMDVVAVGDVLTTLNGAPNPTSTTTFKSISVKVSIVEEVIKDEISLFELYGDALDLISEPKITAISQNLQAGTSFDGAVEIPTGTAIIRNFYILKANNVRSNAVVTELGIVDKNETVIFKGAFDTLQNGDEQFYNIQTAEKGLVVLDMTQDLKGNTPILDEAFGLKGWNFVKGDLFDAFKVNGSESGNNPSVRIIRHELITSEALQMAMDQDDIVLGEEEEFI